MSKRVRIIEDHSPEPVIRLGEWRGRRGLVADYGEGVVVPVVSGGAVANPTSHPLGVPTVTGTEIAVDTMLQQPSRITTFVMDITQQRFILDRLFTSAGGVTGGALVYDVVVANELYLDRDVEPVSPNGEFPVVVGHRRAPAVAEVEKWGGKYPFSDEARDRNDQSQFRNQNIQLANTIVRKLNTRAIEVLNAAIAANAGQSQFVGHDWSAAIPGGSNPTAPALTPGADFAMANLLADQHELGIYFNVALLNPINLMELRLFYGGSLEQMLEDNGFDEVFGSNRVPVGSAYFVAEGQVGEMRTEKALGTETWRDPDHERTWVQSSVRPLWAVNNPFAVLQATGL